MCGITGFFGSNLPSESQLDHILSTIVHRGRDDTGNIRKHNFVLGHNRLSIMDVEGGHQPLHDPDTNFYTIANGEIYNYPQWCDRLKENYNFFTHSDTEILLPLYQQFGSGVCHKLDGMFSFIINNEEEFLIARDRIGIKPLYYVEDGDNLVVASELKALIDHYENIKEFPPGHYYSSKEGLKAYYCLPEPDPDSFLQDTELIIPKIRQSLTESVHKRLMSDVPVGVFLSGGLDSSVTAYLMKQKVEQLHSFSVGFADSPDLKSARQIAEYLGTIHHEYIYTEEEMLEILSDVIYHLESYNASLLRSAIPCYIVSRLASEHVKVILTGEGADELFAGYSHLADYEEGKGLHQELLHLLNGLHNINLQRVDRMSMAHGVEARVPFLDTDFIEMALSIDPELKLHQTYGIEKWLLRKAFENDLPSEVIWRNKMEFAQGCASSTFLETYANENISDEAWNDARKAGEPVTSKEELFYYRIFQKHFPTSNAVDLVGVWDRTLH